MMDLYKRLEAEGKIGKFYRDVDGSLKAKPFQEFPKLIRVTGPDGKLRETIVHSQREELAAITYDSSAEVDPVVKERNELLEMVAERDAKAELQAREMEQVKVQLAELTKLLMAKNAEAAEPKSPLDDDE